MSTGTNSAASSSNGPSTTASGINLNHLSRNQLEKIINMRINAQTCHDVKCKKEKEYFQKIISKMADSFTELISQVEKQRRTLQEVVRLHNKICNEFAIPNKINNNQNEVDFQNLRGIAAMFQDFFAKQAKNVGVAVVKQSPPTMIVNMSEISTVSNERKRKFPVAGNVSASPVTFQTSSMNNNNSALAGKQSSIKTPPFTPQKPFTTPSTSKMTAANNFATPLQHKTAMLSGNTINTNLAMATPPTASASAIIYQGKELSFGGGGSNIANSTPKKPKFTLPKTTKIISNIQPNEIDIIQID